MLAIGIFAVFTIVGTTNDNMTPQVSTSTTTTTYNETFEDDTDGQDPNESWYTYEEIPFEQDNVTDTNAHNGSQCFWVYDDTDGLDKYAYFNWTADDTEYFEFWFAINNRANYDARHYILDGNGEALVRIDINDTVVVMRNYTNIIWTVPIFSDWQKIRLDFNFTDNTVRGRLINASSTLADSWCVATSVSGPVDFENTTSFYVTGYTGETIHVFYDDFILSDTDTTTTTSTTEVTDVGGIANNVFSILGIVLIISALMMLVAFILKWRM